MRTRGFFSHQQTISAAIPRVMKALAERVDENERERRVVDGPRRVEKKTRLAEKNQHLVDVDARS